MASGYKGDSHDLRIVLLGAEKSSTGNAILGREAFKESRTEIQSGRVEETNIVGKEKKKTEEENERKIQQAMSEKKGFISHETTIERTQDEDRCRENTNDEKMELKQSVKSLINAFEKTGEEKAVQNPKKVDQKKQATEQQSRPTAFCPSESIKHSKPGQHTDFSIKMVGKTGDGKSATGNKIQQAKLVLGTNKTQILKEKTTTNVVSEKRGFETKIERTQDEDKCSRVPRENKNDEEIEVKQSAKSRRNAFEKTGEEKAVQNRKKSWKASETGQGDQKKQATEQQSRPTGEHTGLRIVMVGQTGAGKSATGNTILGQKEFKEGLHDESVTKECQEHQQTVGGRNISVIDTPGLCDTSLSEEQLKDELVKCVEMSVPGPHAFLLVVRMDIRFTAEQKQTMKWIQENFGEKASQYTIVLLTRGDQVDNPIEEFMTENKHINELVRKCKGRYHVFKNRDVENRSQVTELLEKIERMVKENGGEHYTNEMYQEAQRKIEEEEKRKREEEERRKSEEEEQIRKDEKMKMLTKAKGVALVGTGLAMCAGAAVAGGGLSPAFISGAAAAGGAISPALISGAVAAGGAVVASAVKGDTLSEAFMAGVVAAGNAALNAL